LRNQNAKRVREEKEEKDGKVKECKKRRQGEGSNKSMKKDMITDEISAHIPEATELLCNWNWDGDDDPAASLDYHEYICPCCQAAFGLDTIVCKQLYKLHYILNHIHLGSKSS
jgi:hypothetical protein